MEKLIGKVNHFFNKISVAMIEITDDELIVGDTIHLKGNAADFNQTITSMQIERVPVEKAKKGDQVGVKLDSPVHDHDQVFKVLPD
jgi:translation initiation factor IF-2